MTKTQATAERDRMNAERGAGSHYIKLRNGEWIVQPTPWFLHPHRPPSDSPAPISIFCG